MERSRICSPGGRHHPLQERTHLPPLNLSCQGSSPPPEEERRRLQSYNLLQERSGRTQHHHRQTYQPTISIHGSRDGRTSGTNPMTSRGRSGWNHSFECRNTARSNSRRIHRTLEFESGFRRQGFLKNHHNFFIS